jgi:hypothetical protein
MRFVVKILLHKPQNSIKIFKPVQQYVLLNVIFVLLVF